MFDIIIQKLWIFLNWISRRRFTCIAFFALLSLVLNIGITFFNGIPEPVIHDEFSYLLGASTFAMGRLTNPVHPLWEFFDTFHVLQSPTYMSIYAPAQSCFLAIGKIAFGHPIAGVWISVALMCAVFCWMFYAWLPPRWAIVAAFLVLLRLGFYTYWSHTYWGGAAAAIGGGLAFGGIRYFFKKPSIRSSLATGSGFLILANSRPLEGLICFCMVMIVVLYFFVNKKISLTKKVILMIPIGTISLLTIVFSGIYNKAITGDPFKMPQRFVGEQLTSMPLFIWQNHPPEPELKSKWKADYINNFVLPHYREKLNKFWKVGRNQLIDHVNFYTGFFIVSIILMAFPVCACNRWYLFAFVSIAIVAIVDVFLITIANQAHYLAPISGLIFYCTAESLRLISSLRLGSRHYGRRLVISSLIVIIAIAAFNCSINRSRPGLFNKASIQKQWYTYRASFDLKLRNTDKNHVVIVSYGMSHNMHNEWIYNDPDIDNSRVIWARDLGSVKNRELLSYYPNRQFWTVLHEESTPELVPYSSVKY